VQARSQREPAVILLDDLHWIDPASDVFLAQLVEATAGTRTLLVANFRPEYHADWMQRPSYQQLALQPLGPEAIGELLRELLGSDPSLGDLAERIRERTGGNPFFIEEVVLGLVEAGHLAGEKGAYRLARAVEAIAIPASVQPVLAARIDRLAPDQKEALQAAAVIGKEFSEPVLRHVVGAVCEPPLQEQDLIAALHGLTAAEFIYEEELYPVAVYAFKHPLTQEVAYQSQLTERRQRLHAATARAIETLDAQRLDERAALLAHHWEAAGDALTAADWHRRAAEWLGGRDRLAELRHWQRVRDLVGPDPASPDHMALGVLARVHMLRNSYWLGQRSEHEVSAVFAEGIALATHLGDPGLHAMLHLFYGIGRYVAGAIEEGVASVREGVRWADDADNVLLRFMARVALVSPLALLGHLREAIAVSQEAERLCGRDPEAGVQVVGFSPYAMTLVYRGMALTMLGCLPEASHELEHAAEIARGRGDQDVLAITEVFSSMWCDDMGDAIGALNHARRAVEMAETRATAASTTIGLAVLGRALALNDQCREGAETLERAFGAMREYRTALNIEALVLAALAEAYLGCGDVTRARASADEAVAVARTRHAFELEAHLARVRVLLGSEGTSAAAEVEAVLRDAEAAVQRSEARVHTPFIHVERAELARLVADEAGYQRELREAYRLFVEMGATGQAEKVSHQLSALGRRSNEPMMQICPACGHENRETARFCGACAAPLVPEVTCHGCGAPNPSAQKFCDACGASLGGRASRRAAGGEQDGSAGASPSQARAPRSYTPKHLADKILQSKSALEGERKQVTVLFADVKGSMELAEQVDPEEWHEILDRFFQILTDGVHRFEGTVNQYTGDGIMALFGAPIAHEDHAQRACYAALRLGEELRGYAAELRARRGLNFSVRMGLNSGEVVVGRIGDDLRMDYTAQGHTVGLAARMDQLAEVGRVYLTEHTGRLVEGLFRLGDLGLFTVKGVHDPLRVYELQGVGPLRTRLEVAARRGLSRFVGRREQLEQLKQAWEAAHAGHGQIVAVMGEAGIGKSRLFHEFKVPLQAQCPVLETFSVSHGKAYAYLPVIDLLRTYFHIALEDDERARREKVTGKVLALDRTLEDTLPYVFALLGIQDPTSALPQMDAQVRRRRTLEAIKRILVRETLDQPVTLICEDLHWFDGESQALLDLLVESVATARLLLLVNYRPEYHHGWGSKTYYTQLRLDPLGKAEAGELLAALLGPGAAAGLDRLQGLILDKTEGNPFFIEEVVQTLAEEGVLRGDRGSYRVEKVPAELHIPVTVGVRDAAAGLRPRDRRANRGRDHGNAWWS